MSPLIIALDFSNRHEAFDLIDKLNPELCALKVGSEMFTHFGPDFVKELVSRKFRVFLDLKFHDIPNTVAHACSAAANLGVWMINIHASGGTEMMKAAKKALLPYGSKAPLLIAVTVLTSMQEFELKCIGVDKDIQNQVLHLASLALSAGLDGIVCSAMEASLLKNHIQENCLLVTPGIRLPNSEKDDQHRIMTPTEAIAAGSDYLVIGRPVTRANDPAKVIREILSDLASSQHTV